MYAYHVNTCTFDQLIGKILTEVKKLEKESEEVIFVCSDGSEYTMYHSQDCCESVCIDDVEGDISDLIGSPITIAEESTSDTNPEGVAPEYQDSFTWTFYRLATAKGFVVIRWYGESNGYYSESVDFANTTATNTEE